MIVPENIYVMAENTEEYSESLKLRMRINIKKPARPRWKTNETAIAV
jgi:hypothetical protein